MAGRSSKGAERLLSLRGNTWWFRRAVGKDCRHATGGKAFLLVNLHTADTGKAKRLRDELEALTTLQFREIKTGRRAHLELPGRAATAETAAPAYRGALSRSALQDATDEDEQALIRDAAEDERDSLKPSQRRAFEDAYAGRVEIDHHLVDYLQKADLAPKTAAERRGLVGRFAQWCRDKGKTLDRVDRRLAGQYVSEVIDPMHPATQHKHLTALRGYWGFLSQRGLVDLPTGAEVGDGWPWKGQLVNRRGKRVSRGDRKEQERPFRDAEVSKLLETPFPLRPEWRDLMTDVLRVSLLSGMRQAEVLTLWVEEVREGEGGLGLVFDIQQGKTEAAARRVPVHPELIEMVQRRLKGKQGSNWLFHEVASLANPGDTYGKRFRRWREAVGVDDQREGVRRSLVNFHSARRWFATAADRAGVREAVIKDVVGHRPDQSNVTRRAYIARASESQMRECVEAVRLPRA
jgi:integrase